MTILFDSDILIEITQGRDSKILAQWEELANSENTLLCCPVSVAELWQGVLPKEQEALKQFFTALPCLPVTAETGYLAGEYLRRYGKSHSVELGGALIAAGAVEHNAMLWTRNRKHSPMKNLKLF